MKLSKSLAMHEHPLIVHYHIFKNAGTSVDLLLKRCFGSNWASFEGNFATDIVSAARLREFFASRSQLKAVSSHLARPPLPHASAYPIVFLRHPVARALSVYTFAAADPNQPDHAIAKSRGFRGYVEWAIGSKDGGVVIRNYQVIHLSEASFRASHIYLTEALDRDLELAKNMIDSWGIVGIVRRFDDSCRLFQKRYGNIFPELALTPIHANASSVAFQSEAEEVEAVREKLGETLYRAVLEVNALDIALYDFALTRFVSALDANRSGGN